MIRRVLLRKYRRRTCARQKYRHENGQQGRDADINMAYDNLRRTQDAKDHPCNSRITSIKHPGGGSHGCLPAPQPVRWPLWREGQPYLHSSSTTGSVEKSGRRCSSVVRNKLGARIFWHDSRDEGGKDKKRGHRVAIAAVRRVPTRHDT